jgi:hypothetical protein
MNYDPLGLEPVVLEHLAKDQVSLWAVVAAVAAMFK